MKRLKLFFACLLMTVLSIGQVWATDATMATGTNASECTVNGNDGIKVGTSKNGGTMYITVGEGATKLTFYAAAWKGVSELSLNITGATTSPASVALSADNGISNNSPFTLSGSAENFKHEVLLSNITAATTLTFTSSGEKRFVVWSATYETGSTPPAPTKTLESVAVSGTPTKTSYTAGEDFDPAGLTVMGHYSDNSDEAITSGITWAYNPSQTLAENQTSIGVTATVSNIASDEFEVTGLTVAAAPAAVEYVLFSGDLEEGDYVIYYGGYAMNNTIANDRLQYTEVTPSDNKITNPDASIVWHIAQSGSYWTIYNAAVAKYAAGTGAKNKAQLLADGTDNKSLWTASGDETYDFVNKANDAAGVNKTLRNNGTYGFACYATSTGGPLSLYKKVDDQVAVVKPAILGDTYFLESSEVSMTCTTDGAEIRYTLDGTDPTASSTLYENPFTLTEPTTVKAIAIKGTDVSAIADKEFTKATVKTVAEALAMSATDDVYVTGYISTITEVSTSYKNATYRISDDGTTTSEMIVYHGKYLNNTDFTDENKDNIHVGDKVIVRGGLVLYNSAMQLAAGNYLISIEYPEVAIPTFAPTAESFLESVEVSLACSTDGAEIRYTLDGTDPTATSTLYENPFTLTETTTVKAIAIKGGTTTSVVSKTYTKQEIMTVAEALASSAANGVYVKGIISTITEVSTGYKNATYRISDNGTKTDEMIVYRGRYINNTDFTSEDQIELGDEVIVYGNLTEYNNAMQLATGNYLISLVRKASAELAWNPAEDIEITVGDAFSAPALLNPNNIDASEITIASNNTDLAVVNDGVVSLVADATGTAKITATFAGDDTYKAAEVSYTVTVSAAAPVLTDYYEKVTSGDVEEGTYLIVYETGNVAFNGGLETLDAENNTIAVDITSDNKIGVTQATAAATFYIDPAEGTIKSASDHYIGVSSWSNGLKQTATYVHNVLEIDGDGNAQVGIYNAEWNTTGGTMLLQYNKGAGQERFRYFKNGGQQSIALYKLANEVLKSAAGLAWDPAEDIEITVGDAFSAPALLNPNNIDAAEISIESSNTGLATVTAGEVALVADATGTTTITATFAGNDNFKPATVSYKITVNPAHSIYVSPGLNVNFGSVQKDATVDDKVITITLTEVAAATLTLAGDGASAFSIDPTAAMTQSGDITISASSATAGTFAATLTISDDAGEAASKVVNLSLTVVDPATVETAISTTSEWVPATEIVDGMQVLITGVASEVVYAMGEQKSTNRAAYVATLNEGVLTPGEGTMAFTLVAQGDGTYAIRTSNGKYLYAAKNDANHLKTQDEVDVNAKWTLTIESAVAEGSSNRNIMRFNSGSSKLFSCYASGQQPIKFYVPKQETPEPPTPDYGSYQRDVPANSYGTICLPKAGHMVSENVILFEVSYKENDAVIYLDEVLTGEMEAGMPYIFYSAGEQIKVEYTDNESATAKDKNGLYGTLAHIDDMSGEGIYMIYQNQLRHSTSSASYLDANRAYIKLGEVSTTAQPKQSNRRRVAMGVQGEQVATGIDALNASDKPAKMIINGQLFIIRGEKMYNVNGQLVK